MNTINDKTISASYVAPITKSEELKDIKLNNKPSSVLLDSQNNQVGKTLSNESQDKLIREVNSKMLEITDQLAFKKDNASGRNVYSLIDSESKQIIKQFPSEEFLDMSKNLKEYIDSRSMDGKTGSGSLLNAIV